MGTVAFSAAGTSKPLTSTEDQGRLVRVGEKVLACPQANKGTRDALGGSLVLQGRVIPGGAWQQGLRTCTAHPPEGAPRLAFSKAG